MKLKQIICIALISSFFFSGCGSSNNSEILPPYIAVCVVIAYPFP